MTKNKTNSSLLLPLIAILLLSVLALDTITQLGIADIVLYCIPVALSLWGGRPILPIIIAVVATVLNILGFFISPVSNDFHVAILNRLIGGITMWAMALMVRQIVLARNESNRLTKHKDALTKLANAVRGELQLEQIGEHVLTFLAEITDMKMGAIFDRKDDETILNFVSGMALQKAHIKYQIPFGEGFVGEVAVSGKSMMITNVSKNYYKFTSSLGEEVPSFICIFPLIANNQVIGVIEAAYREKPNERVLELLKDMGETVAIAIRSVQYKTRLSRFNQRLEEELEAQHEELKNTNEELEQHAKALKESNNKLENQQTELEQTNQQLEEQTQQLEQQKNLLDEKNRHLIQFQMTLIDRAKEMEMASKFKSEFLANMSHELRTPLNSSLILAKILSENKDGNLTPEQINYAQIIYSSGNDLLGLINDILDLSKVEAGKIILNNEKTSTQSILEGLERTFQPEAAQKGLILEVQVVGKVPVELVTDRFRLEQVLKNFLSNAMKFTERGQITLSLHANEDNVVFEVKDTGIGIDPRHQDVIFEAFRQADGTTNRKYGGTGLGLSISKELALLLGGKIHLKSEQGKGSTFALELPINIQKNEPTNQLSFSMLSDLKPLEVPASENKNWQKFSFTDDRDKSNNYSRKVLIIEDNENFARTLYDFAHEMQYSAIVAPTAEEALWLLKKQKPQAVLLDVKLPDHNGLIILDQLKRDPSTRHIPVHVISGFDFAKPAQEMGAISFLSKPVRQEQLREAFNQVSQLLEQKMKHVLVVEDDSVQRNAIINLISTENLKVVAVASAEEALNQLSSKTFDCMIVDLNLQGMSGHEFLETISREGSAYSNPPVIIYTARDLHPEEEERLRKLSESIIIKGERSSERLLNEVGLFLHLIESDLSLDRQKMLSDFRGTELPLNGRKILIADDDSRNIFALTSALEKKGATIIAARNGREAVDKVKTKTDLDLVLMDIMMPEMDGLEAIRYIRAENELKNLPIIALTAKAMSDDREKCLAVGANDYLAKPVEVDKLLSLIKVWLPIKRGQDL